MPNVFLPYILPNSIEFVNSNESSLTQTVYIYNPYAFDILFKVDNAQPQKYVVSNRQGLISSRQKLPLEITCRGLEVSLKEEIQVRFFKWSKVRHGQKPKPQQYLGFREISLYVTDGHSQRERTPSQASDHVSLMSFTSQSTRHSMASSPPQSGSSIPPSDSIRPWHGADSSDAPRHHHHLHHLHRHGQKFQVISNIIVALVLLLMGFLLNKANEDWFSLNVMEGIKPQTLAIVAYTLAGVVIIRLLTYR